MTDQDRIDAIAQNQPPFAQLLGVRVMTATPDRVEMELPVTQALSNRNGTLHGGAFMAFADNLGGTATFLNLAKNEGTSTLESKTNFFRALPVGEVARGVAVPLHRGRSTMVWQITISTQDGRLAAMVTQTQMILRRD